jgi:hypothetical protein
MHNVPCMLFDLIVSPTHSFSQFSKETNAFIDESKLRVVLVDASRPPVEQLINSVPNTDAAVEVPVSRHTLNVENEVPVMEKEVPAPQEQISALVTDIPSPVKQSPILQEVPVILHEEPAILAESPPPLKNQSHLPVKDESPSPIKDTSAITIEQLPLKENSVTSKESSLEETLPKEAVTLSDRGLFSVQNHQLSHVTEDVQNLKSKVNNLESKLEGAEKMITKLREESRSMTQERDKLQQEMVFLQKKGNPKNQLGFPLLFVVYVALLGTSLGYLLRL